MTDPDGITVTGTGTATATPDVLRVVLAAQVRAGTVQQAFDGAAEALERIRSVLRAGGVAAADLASTDAHLSPYWEERLRREAGFQASLGLYATLRDVAAAGRLVTAAVAAGGDASRLHGMSLTVDDPAPLRHTARERAWADARGRAEQYARLAGRPLGGVLAIVEGPPGHPVEPVAAVRGEALAEVAAAFDPGTASVSATVQVRWALG